MNQNDLKQFIDLLDQDKLSEAKQLIQKRYKRKLFSSNSDQAGLAAAQSYIKAINQVNRHYLHTMNLTINRLNELRQVKRALNTQLIAFKKIEDRR